MNNYSFRLSLFLLVIFGFLISHEAQRVEAKELSVLYKATTIDECIQEKECVWFAFSKMLELRSSRGKVLHNKQIAKWNSSISYTLLGADEKDLESSFAAQNLLSLISKQEIQIHSGEKLTSSNYIIFSNNAEEAYKTILNKKNRKYYGSKFKRRYMEIYFDGMSMPRCFIERFIDKNTNSLVATYSFVNASSQYSEVCYQAVLYNSLGFSGRHLIGEDTLHPFSLFSITTSEYTKLDMFLLFLLYQDDVKGGENYEELKEIFDETYKGKLHEFLHVFAQLGR